MLHEIMSEAVERHVPGLDVDGGASPSPGSPEHTLHFKQRQAVTLTLTMEVTDEVTDLTDV